MKYSNSSNLASTIQQSVTKVALLIALQSMNLKYQQLKSKLSCLTIITI